MLKKRWHERPITFRSTTGTVIADCRFPRAVAGEDYDRYVRAVWRQGERWFARWSHRIGDGSLGVAEAREVLWSIATMDLSRRLYPQEERLLSELLQEHWTNIQRWEESLHPEIPSFLLEPNRGPLPA